MLLATTELGIDSGMILVASRPQAAAVIAEVKQEAKSKAFRRFSLLPAIMAACYLGLILFFASKGGYKPVELHAPAEPK